RQVLKDIDGNMQETVTLEDTTVGRALLFDILPDGLPLSLVNQAMTKKAISKLINASYRNVGLKETVIFADQLMYTGFYYATVSGSSIGVNDFVIPDEKHRIIQLRSEERRVGKECRSGWSQ